jgi:branched-chain amino acid transport system permease protein
VDITVLAVVMAVLGGSGTVWGPVIGAVSLQYLSEWLRDNFTDYHTFVFGAIIVVAVLILPMGVVTFVKDAWRERRFGPLDAVKAYRL